MDPAILLLITGGAGAIGFYMAWSIDSNDDNPKTNYYWNWAINGRIGAC